MRAQSAVVAAVLVLVGCGGGDDTGAATDTERLASAIAARGENEAAADCMASAMIRAGISSTEVEEFVAYEQGDAFPAAEQLFTDARFECDGVTTDNPAPTTATTLDIVEYCEMKRVSYLGWSEDADFRTQEEIDALEQADLDAMIERGCPNLPE
jgi:hypothetical protein